MASYRIEYAKSFTKQFAKLRSRQKDRFYERLEIFSEDAFDERLRNHALKGKYEGYRSIDIEGDLRALYILNGDTIVIFAFIGSHSQLY